jgi:hypothetical protein
VIDGRMDRWIFGWEVLVGDVLFSRGTISHYCSYLFFSLSEPDIGHSPITTRLLNGWGGVFDATEPLILPHEHLRPHEMLHNLLPVVQDISLVDVFL